MFTNKKDDSVDEFWREFEETTGETVLAKSLGRYLNGQEERPTPLWGLTVVTSGGFRFRHFPKEPSIFGIPKLPASGKAPKDQSFFIPKETLVSIKLVLEKRWWKKLLASSFPRIIIHCQIDGTEKKVTIEVDHNAAVLADALNGFCPAGSLPAEENIAVAQ